MPHSFSPTATATRHRRASLSNHDLHIGNDLHVRVGRVPSVTTVDDEAANLHALRRNRRFSDNVRLVVSDDPDSDDSGSKVKIHPGVARPTSCTRRAFRSVCKEPDSKCVLGWVGMVASAWIIFIMWLMPEIAGSDLNTLLVGGKTCMVLDSFNLEVAGNANRMESLLLAAEISRSKGYSYLAVDQVWQEWICKILSDDSIVNLGKIITIVPTGKPFVAEHCKAFSLLYKHGYTQRPEDSCETGWSHSSFFRYPRYHTNPEDRFPFSDWKLLAPTGHGVYTSALARVEALRAEHPGKNLVAVHKRWLSRICHKDINLKQVHRSTSYERYCHYTPDIVRLYMSHAGLAEEDAHVRVSSDHLMPEEDKLFSAWTMESEDVPFLQQVWLWVLADVFIGNPLSTIDQAACRWRTMYCKGCSPCLPLLLHKRAHAGFLEGSVPSLVPNVPLE